MTEHHHCESDDQCNPPCTELQELKKMLVKIGIALVGASGTIGVWFLGKMDNHENRFRENEKNTAVLEQSYKAIEKKQDEMHEDIRELLKRKP